MLTQIINGRILTTQGWLKEDVCSSDLRVILSNEVEDKVGNIPVAPCYRCALVAVRKASSVASV